MINIKLKYQAKIGFWRQTQKKNLIRISFGTILGCKHTEENSATKIKLFNQSAHSHQIDTIPPGIETRIAS